jgi:radical SAM protein with 4Fe4S-binding SPASM domain
MNPVSLIQRNTRRFTHLLLHPNRLVRIKRFRRYQNAQGMLRLAEQEMREGLVTVKSRPVYMHLDTGPLCNLNCRFCCTANGLSTLKRELLKPEIFEHIAQNLPLDSLYQVGLYNWGEPLLNPHLFQYIEFFAKQGIWTVIHTNFSFADHDEAFMEGLILSGIGDVTASVDGATQGNYEKYRVGGNLNRALANLRLLAKTKNRMKSDTPVITYKMMLNRYNQDEIEDARKIAESIGVQFEIQEVMGTPDAETHAEWSATRMLEKHGNTPVSSVDRDADVPVITECRQLWDTLIVNADGAVYPCCLVYHADSAVGNLTAQHFDEIWNGEKMQRLRQYILDSNTPAPDFAGFCSTCPFRNCSYRSRKQLSTMCP